MTNLHSTVSMTQSLCHCRLNKHQSEGHCSWKSLKLQTLETPFAPSSSFGSRRTFVTGFSGTQGRTFGSSRLCILYDRKDRRGSLEVETGPPKVVARPPLLVFGVFRPIFSFSHDPTVLHCRGITCPCIKHSTRVLFLVDFDKIFISAPCIPIFLGLRC